MARIEITSEVTGNVWKIEAAVGDHLNNEDVIMILESMKMEIPITAPKPGKLSTLHVVEQDIVAEEQLIASLDAE